MSTILDTILEQYVCVCVCVCVCVLSAFFLISQPYYRSYACNFIIEALQVIQCAKSLYLFGFLKPKMLTKIRIRQINVPYTSARCVYKLPRTIGENTQSKLHLCDVITEALLFEF